ncbi:uncharacterized protein PV09_05141 [Verruconis gallopava]|uniref:Uncharacterized protein n=1 Tax=Verruconis gallopava TaxID=253628 RepID=A0A0D1YT78_9PEZI|nr:uncharacterized protein PV09_05141 [Verruconis gallopava]KIW03842.1 hypothetical protein PV09_05141 [Verruconis gallopava]
MRASKSILLSVISLPLVLSDPVVTSNVAPTNVDFDFQELLAVLPAESLHAALHKHVDDKFQDGVYEHERIAVEKVHSDDPVMATKVLAEAALHLLKRQSSNDNSTSTTSESGGGGATTITTDTTETTTTTQSDVVVPIDVSTTGSGGQPTTLTTSVVASPTVSVEQAVTTTNSQGQQVVETTTVPAAVVTQDGVVTTSPVSVFTPSTVTDATKPVDVTATVANGDTIVLSSVTPGKVITATDKTGGVFVTTYTPPGGTVSSLVLKTTVLPNGQKTTITSFAAVAADTSAPSSTGGPKLQSGVDSLQGRSLAIEAIVLLCAAFGASLLL